MLATDTPSSAPSVTPAVSSGDVRATGLNAPKFIAGSIGGVFIAAALLALVALLANQPDWWRGYFAGAVAGLVAAVVSAVPILFLFRQPLAVLMNGYLAIGGLRAIAIAAIVIVAVKAGGYPKIPTVAFAGLFYVALVAVEGMLLWSMVSASRFIVTNKTPTTQDNA